MFPILSPLRRMTLTLHFCGKYRARWWHKTDSVFGLPNLSVYMTVILSLLMAKPEGHTVMHIWSIIAPTMWPGRKMSWKWCECESDITQGCARKSTGVGSLRDISPVMSLASWYDSIPFHFHILVFPLQRWLTMMHRTDAMLHTSPHDRKRTQCSIFVKSLLLAMPLFGNV